MGKSGGHQRADPLTAHGQILLALDTRMALLGLIGGPVLILSFVLKLCDVSTTARHWLAS